MLHLIVACALLCQDYTPPKPGPHHEHLKAFMGNWDYTAEFRMGEEVSKSKGTQTETMSTDGLWQVIDTRGEMEGQKFWGHGIGGYDSTKKKYVGVWVDSMGDFLQISEGECSDDGKTLTMWVEIPGQDGKPMKMKEVSKIVDKDHKTLTFSADGPDGKEMEIGKISYTRKK
jgi:hypothetical protein